MSNNALAGGGVGVSIEESADRRIVVTALEIIESGLYFSAGAMRPYLTTFPAVFSQANPLFKYTKNHAKSQHDLSGNLKLPPQSRGEVRPVK